MAPTGLIDDIRRRLVDERTAYAEQHTPAGARFLRDSQAKLAATLEQVGKSGIAAIVLGAERVILQNEFEHYANSRSMRTSLGNSLAEHGAAMRMLERVETPSAYAAIDAAHSLPRNRIKDLPRDEARQFFRSHGTRLLNLDKARLPEWEKRIITIRRSNLRAGETAYAALQRRALAAIAAQRQQDQGLGLNQ